MPGWKGRTDRGHGPARAKTGQLARAWFKAGYFLPAGSKNLQRVAKIALVIQQRWVNFWVLKLSMSQYSKFAGDAGSQDYHSLPHRCCGICLHISKRPTPQTSQNSKNIGKSWKSKFSHSFSMKKTRIFMSSPCVFFLKSVTFEVPVPQICTGALWNTYVYSKRGFFLARLRASSNSAVISLVCARSRISITTRRPHHRGWMPIICAKATVPRWTPFNVP